VTIAHVISGAIFVLTFLAILSERLHRATVAMVGAGVMVAAGLLFGFYSQEQALRAIDFNTLGLLLGMMILVHLLERTGFFQYLAIVAAKWSRGDPWLLLIILATTTAVVSMFLNNATTIVLVVPVTILIAEILGVHPVPLLMAEAVLSNVGGVATLIGDPPNIVIGSAANFSFVDFITRLGPIVVISMLMTLLTLRIVFRRELALPASNVEALTKLNEREAVHDGRAMRRILIALGLAILLFFVHTQLRLTPAFVAMSGAVLALVWTRPDVDEALKTVEWSVLLFFAALFVVVGGVEDSGLLDLAAEQVKGLARGNLMIAGLILIWVAAILSAIVDNIPFTIAMVPVIQHLGEIGVPMSPLWWALAIGVGFGGNGTPIGSTAGVLTVALSEKTHTPITTSIWLRSGLPITLVSCLVASVLYVVMFAWMMTP